MAELSFLAPELEAGKRSRVISVLFEGLQIGNETRVDTDDAKFILQNVTPMGIWFHVEAANAED